MAVQGISRDGSKLIGWATLPVPLATLAVILRFLSRKSVKRIGIDDWCMLVALFIYYGLYISLVVWGPVGKVGFPQSDLSYAQVEDFLKLFFCVQIFYAWVGPTIKISFLLFYRRVFVIKWFLHVTVGIGALVVVWCLSVTFSVIFECQPVGSYWQPKLQQHCIDSQKFYWANGISNLLLDVIILCLPVPMIWKLQMSTKRKISLTLVFALGIFICIASILRITYLWLIVFDNVSGTIAIPSIWTSLEPGLGIVCGCLPTFPILFRTWWEAYTSRRGTGASKLISLTNKTPHSAGKTQKSDKQASYGTESQVDLRFERDVEMEAYIGTSSIGSRGSLPSREQGNGIRKDVSLSLEHS